MYATTYVPHYIPNTAQSFVNRMNFAENILVTNNRIYLYHDLVYKLVTLYINREFILVTTNKTASNVVKFD